MPALAFVESRLDIDAESSEKAFGLMQLMPSTWAELALEDEDPDNAVDQINVAARLMNQSYRYVTSTCNEELTIIKDTFFEGDSAVFEEYFLTPLILNAYNAGMGTMAEIVKNFVQNFSNKESLRPLAKGKSDLTDLDVFFAMTHVAEANGWGKIYKDHAKAYTPTLYAAHNVLIETYQKILNGEYDVQKSSEL